MNARHRLRKLSGAVVYIHFAPHAASFEQLALLFDAIAACVVEEYGASLLLSMSNQSKSI